LRLRGQFCQRTQALGIDPESLLIGFSALPQRQRTLIARRSVGHGPDRLQRLLVLGV